MFRHLIRAAVIALALLAPLKAFAQSNTDTYFYTPGGGGVNGAIGMCLNTANKAVPCSAPNVLPSPVSVTPFPGNPATGSSANPITGNAAGAAGAVVGTLAGAAGKTTYICGFNVSTIGGTASSGPITVAGLVGSSQVYQTPVNAAAGQMLVSQNFNPCIPASAANTAITITTTAALGATAVDVNSWGYQY